MISLTYDVTQDDYLSRARAAIRRQQGKRAGWHRIATRLVMAYLAIWLIWSMSTGSLPPALGVLGLFVLAGIVAFNLFGIPWMVARQFKRDALSKGPMSLTVEDADFVVKTIEAVTRFQWSVIEEIERTDSHLYMWLSGNRALVIPKCAFAGDDEESAFVSFVQTRLHDRETQ